MSKSDAGWHIYIVECADGTLYTGSACDVKKRVGTHNAGTGAKYTRNRLPVRLVYLEPALNKSVALRREYEIKQLTRIRKIALINRAAPQSA